MFRSLDPLISGGTVRKKTSASDDCGAVSRHVRQRRHLHHLWKPHFRLHNRRYRLGTAWGAGNSRHHASAGNELGWNKFRPGWQHQRQPIRKRRRKAQTGSATSTLARTWFGPATPTSALVVWAR